MEGLQVIFFQVRSVKVTSVVRAFKVVGDHFTQGHRIQIVVRRALSIEYTDWNLQEATERSHSDISNA